MDRQATTRLGVPGPRPLGPRPSGQAANGPAAPASTTGLTLGTLREVRNELASLGSLLDTMTTEMAGLRSAVQLMADRQERLSAAAASAKGADTSGLTERLDAIERRARKDRKRAAKAAVARDDDTAKRLGKIERKIEKLERRVAWIG